MYSWEDSEAQDGPFSPFWNVAPMLGCVLDEYQPPLLGLAAGEIAVELYGPKWAAEWETDS